MVLTVELAGTFSAKLHSAVDYTNPLADVSSYTYIVRVAVLQ